MQFSAEFVALHTHSNDVLRGERELGLRRDAADAGSGDESASPEPSARRRHVGHRVPRLALR